MSKQLRLDVAQLTDVGRKRPHNEDNMAYVIPKDQQVMARKGALFIVADGMGGHAAGEVASEIAVDTVSNAYYLHDSDDAAISLLYAIKRANSLIHQRAAENMLRSGMGTTCVAAVLRGNIAYVANVGDSRAYLVRHGQVRQVSQDHSWVAEQVRAGLLTEDQARSHAQRNVITRCLGTQADVEVDVFSEPLEEGDSLVLCSDGLSGLVGDEELRMIVDQYVPQESVYHLVERANENGGPDNITAIVIRVQEVGWEPPGARYPVRVGGGREVGEEDTEHLGRLPSTPLSAPLRAEDLRVPSGGLRAPSGVLLSPNGMSAPPPHPLAKKGIRRLLYPAAIVLLILVVVLIGSGTYVILRMRGSIVDVDGTLSSATGSMEQARGDVNANRPSNALQDLAKVRDDLLRIQVSSLSDTQRTTFNNLQATFVRTVQQAGTIYNHQYQIVTLPCDSTNTTPITSGNTQQATSLAVLQGGTGKNSLTYILASDKNIYSLTPQGTLGTKFQFPASGRQVETLANDGSRLVALFSTPAQGQSISYGLSLLVPQQDGTLKEANSTILNMPAGYTPKFVTIVNTTVSVVLVQQIASTQPQILNYTLSGTGVGQHFNTPPTNATISVSKMVVDVIAASMGKQGAYLFFLLSDGSIQSLPLADGNNTTSSSPVNVQLTASIPAPLALSANFALSAQTPVPTPVSVTTTTLSVPGATLLAAGTELGENGHFYVVAMGGNGIGPRILDLKMVAGPPATTPTSTTASRAPTPGGTVGGGLATQSASLYMTLVQQYAPSSALSNAKGISVDPKGNGFYLLTQNGQGEPTLQLASVNLPLQKTCLP